MATVFGWNYRKSLVPGARAAITEVLAVRKNERILIITNPDKELSEISTALYDSVLEAKAIPVLIFQREKAQFDFAEEEVIKAIATNPDATISISKDRLGKDGFGLKHGYKGKRRYDHVFDLLYEEAKMRAFWSPGVTVDMFCRTVPIDYTRMRADAFRLNRIIEISDRVRVTAPGGTDITVGVRGRKPRADDGNFTKPGRAGNVPSGETYVSPTLGTAHGTIAFDASMVLNEGEVIIKNPIMAEVEGGFIKAVTGGKEATMLLESIREGERKARMMGKAGQLSQSSAKKYARNAWSIGELGVGLNRNAKIVANMLEDEKVYGTCHFAVGSNYDGDADAMIHLDGLVNSPTICALDGSGRERQLMVDGRLVWD